MHHMYSIARNLVCKYWDITSSQHTIIGPLGQYRPVNETNILKEFRWRADSGPIYMGLVSRNLLRVLDQVIRKL